MPSKKPMPPSHGVSYIVLALMILACGILVKSAAPVMPAVTVLATAKPMPSPTLPSIPIIPTDAPEATITEEPAPVGTLLDEQLPGFLLGQATPAPEPSAASPAPTLSAWPAATPTEQPIQSSFLLEGATAAPSPTAALTGREKASFLLDSSATVMPTSAITAPPTAVPSPTAAATASPTPTFPVLALAPTPTPRPGPTPTYDYEGSSVRIEITRHTSQPGIVYFATEIWLSDITQLRSAFSSDQFNGPTEIVQDIALRNNAVLAINGDFATFNDGGIIIRNGDVYRTNRSTRQLLVINQHGDFIPYIDPPENSEEVAAEFHEQNVWQTFVFGPVLVENGKPVELPTSFFINTKGAREPRTAIAQMGPLHYLILTVDGRQDDYSRGVTLAELQDLFIQHGAITAFNLDGGGSTTLCFYGNILNRPANGSQRHVPDILYITY